MSDGRSHVEHIMNTTPIERRHFLAGLAATPMLLGAAPPEGRAAATPTGKPRGQWTHVRAQFALSPDWIHMAGFLLASHPRRVRDAIERYRLALDNNPALALEQPSPNVLKPAAAYLGVRPEEIALTDSTTMGLAVLYHGLPLRAGDEVLTTEHDHYATHESLRLATERSGATLRKVALYEKPAAATVESMAHAIRQAIAPNTRVVAITWVHSSTGVKAPVRAIADVIAGANAGRAPLDRIMLCVDGVHGLGVENVTMADLACDFFVAGTHKWMFGP